MRQSVIAIVAGILFFLLFSYAFNYLSPWNFSEVDHAISRYGMESGSEFIEFVEDSIQLGTIWKLLDIRNVIIMLLIFGGGQVLTFAGIHMLIDKIFFKKFYEQPNHFAALRRGALIFIIICTLVFLKSIGGLIWYNIFAVVLLAVLIEYAFSARSVSDLKDSKQTQDA